MSRHTRAPGSLPLVQIVPQLMSLPLPPPVPLLLVEPSEVPHLHTSRRIEQ
jgi:hypothetical protein